jgi:hypothetical protein
MTQDTEIEKIEVRLPGRAGTVSLHLSATGKGDELSWIAFMKKRFIYADNFKKNSV